MRWELFGAGGQVWIGHPSGKIVTEGIEDTNFHRIVLRVACDAHNTEHDALTSAASGPSWYISRLMDNAWLWWSSQI